MAIEVDATKVAEVLASNNPERLANNNAGQESILQQQLDEALAIETGPAVVNEISTAALEASRAAAPATETVETNPAPAAPATETVEANPAPTATTTETVETNAATAAPEAEPTPNEAEPQGQTFRDTQQSTIDEIV